MNKNITINSTIWLLIIIILSIGLYSQDSKLTPLNKPFYYDAICFKSNTDTLSRVDVFIIVPYHALYFSNKANLYFANLDIYVEISDTNNQRIIDKRIVKKISETDYFVSQGGTGKFEKSQFSFDLKQGKYNIAVKVTDNQAKKDFYDNRTLTLINYNNYPFAISGIMLISSIEENGSKHIITPHVSDNIGDLKDGFFLFFESYTNTTNIPVDYFYEIYDEQKNVIFKSERFTKELLNNRNQTYLKVNPLSDTKQGKYILRLIAIPTNTALADVSETSYLAIAERSIYISRSVSGLSINDLSKSIRQLRYVASQAEIDYIEAGGTIDEKMTRFEEFWKKLDPTPNSARNEAFDEYYSRIEYTNKAFKSYSEGWLTDKGHVYIVYGAPNNVEKANPYNDGRTYERWTYLNNRQILFIDNSGFGDYRLSSPSVVTEKYHYQN